MSAMLSINDTQRAVRRTDEVDLGDLQAVNEFALASQDPVIALQALAGMPPDKILYAFKQGKDMVVGPTVATAKVLASRRGGLRTHPPEFQDVTLPLEDHEGEWRDVPAVRAIVMVEDTRTGTVFCGTATQAKFIFIKYGDKAGQMRLDPKADQVAASKAERNAILSHFAGVIEVIKELALRAIEQKQAFFKGQASDEAEEVSREIAVQQAKRYATRSGAPLGPMGRDLFLAELKAAADASGTSLTTLREDFDAWLDSEPNLTGLKISDIPKRDLPKLHAWLAEKRQQLGLDADTAHEEAAEAVIPDDDDSTADDELTIGVGTEDGLSADDLEALRAEAAAADAAQAAETAAAAKPATTARRAAPKPAAQAGLEGGF